MFAIFRRLFGRRFHHTHHASTTSPSMHSAVLDGPERGFFLSEEETRYSATYADGRFTLRILQPHVFAWTEARGIEHEDFCMQAGISLPAGRIGSLQNGCAAGFLFRMAAADSFMVLMLGDSGAIRLEAVFNGEPQSIIGWTECPWVDTSRELSLVLIARGSRYTALVDGRIALEADDDRLRRGGWAFAGQNYGQQPNVSLHLHSFQVQADPMLIEQDYLRLVKKAVVEPDQRRRMAESYMALRRWPAAWQQLSRLQDEQRLEANDHFMLAECYLHEDLYGEAEKQLLLCLDLDPAHPAAQEELYNVLYLQNRFQELRDRLAPSPGLKDSARLNNLYGHALYNLADWPGAADAYTAAARLDESMPIYQLNAARAWEKARQASQAAAAWLAAAQGFLNQSALDDASHCLDQLDSLGFDKNQLSAMHARIAYEQGNSTEAEKRLAALVKKGKADAAACYTYGLILSGQGRTQEARKHFARARELEPDRAIFHFRYTESLFLGGEDCDALITEGIARFPEDGWMQNLAGMAALRSPDLELAEACFERAVTLLPQQPEPLINLAATIASRGRVDEALARLDSYRELPAARNSAGNILAAAGRLDAAEQAYRQACLYASRQLPVDAVAAAEYHTNLGACLIELGDWAEAGEALRHALELHTTSRALVLMGDVWQETGEYIRAEAAWLSALDYEPEGQAALYRLGSSYCHRAKYQQAEEMASRLEAVDAVQAEQLRQRIHHASQSQVDCSGCGRSWSFPRLLPETPRTQLRGALPDTAPAGACPDCGAIYCVACRKDHLDGGRFTCARCGSHLKLLDDRVRYVVHRIVEAARAEPGTKGPTGRSGTD